MYSCLFTSRVALIAHGLIYSTHTFSADNVFLIRSSVNLIDCVTPRPKNNTTANFHRATYHCVYSSKLTILIISPLKLRSDLSVRFEYHQIPFWIPPVFCLMPLLHPLKWIDSLHMLHPMFLKVGLYLPDHFCNLQAVRTAVFSIRGPYAPRIWPPANEKENPILSLPLCTTTWSILLCMSDKCVCVWFQTPYSSLFIIYTCTKIIQHSNLVVPWPLNHSLYVTRVCLFLQLLHRLHKLIRKIEMMQKIA